VWDGGPRSEAGTANTLVVDGLTKNFRRPGWRIAWTVGPARLIEMISRIASALDGGAPRPLQRAAVELLEPGRARREREDTLALFRPKRDLVARALGVDPPEGTFYFWLRVGAGDAFFREALRRRVIVVPGSFFGAPEFVRISFGAAIDVVRRGVEAISGLCRRGSFRPRR
jgi:aspartate/methionine/tyrosine aminotransferase